MRYALRENRNGGVSRRNDDSVVGQSEDFIGFNPMTSLFLERKLGLIGFSPMEGPEVGPWRAVLSQMIGVNPMNLLLLE